MKTSAEHTSLVLPPALLAEVEAAADEAHQSVAEVVREALERYLAQLRAGATVGQTQPQPTRRTPAEAAARMRENRKGNVLPDGVTIRDLMTHGRA
jgi:Arc/MetJ-type ribon-helix-helix transcriptional regulator